MINTYEKVEQTISLFCQKGTILVLEDAPTHRSTRNIVGYLITGSNSHGFEWQASTYQMGRPTDTITGNEKTPEDCLIKIRAYHWGKL